jgi:SAM-dependent methyltransferase
MLPAFKDLGFAMDESIMELGRAIAAGSDDISPRRADRTVPTLPMLDAYLSMMRASALVAAGRIGVFETLAGGAMETGALAEALNASEIGIGRLATFLVETGHLERHGPLLANAPATQRWFTSRGEVDYSAGLAWTADAWTIMSDLSEAVRRGAPERTLWDRMDEAPALGTRFSRYMRAFAHHLTPDLLRSAQVPNGPTRLLDLGGSHGVHAMSLCQRYPDLDAVIVDLGSALADTEARIDAIGLGDRIAVRRADIRACDWGEDYDVVLYLSVAHNMYPHENARIFAHARAVLRPGGKLVIHEYPHETTPGLFGAAFCLTLLVETGTRTFGYVELCAMLSKAGFSSIRRQVLSPAEKGTIIIAEA